MLARLRIADLEPLIALLRADGLPSDIDAAALAKMADSQLGGVEQAQLDASGIVTDALLDRWLALLTSDRPEARERAARLLGKTGSQRAVEPLVGALEDEAEPVRTAAAEALQQITGQNFGVEVAKWRAWLKNR
jgi:HEAT repeat protein